MPPWTITQIPPQSGHLAVVTGVGGLGYEIALALAAAGASVVLAGRNADRGRTSLERIRAVVPRADIRFEQLDLADLASVRAFAQRMALQAKGIDLLVNNAGVMMLPKRRKTVDDFELQFGTNFLGHFALTGQLLPLLSRGRARVVNVSSSADNFGRIAFDDLQSERRYNPEAAYCQSKLANSLFTLELQRRSDECGWGLTAVTAQPGFTRTDLIANGMGKPNAILGFLWRFASHAPAVGALSILYPATMPDVTGGEYYGPDGFLALTGFPKRISYPRGALDRAKANHLWSVAEQSTHVSFGDAAAEVLTATTVRS